MNKEHFNNPSRAWLLIGAALLLTFAGGVLAVWLDLAARDTIRHSVRFAGIAINMAIIALLIREARAR